RTWRTGPLGAGTRLGVNSWRRPAEYRGVTSSSRAMPLVLAALVAGVAIHGVHAAIAPGHGALAGVFDDWLYTAWMFGGSALALAAVRRHRRERAAWAAIA